MYIIPFCFSLGGGGRAATRGLRVSGPTWRHTGRVSSVYRWRYQQRRGFTSLFPNMSVVGPDPVFAQTMLRVKDPVKSRRFYEGLMGMKYLTRLDFPALDFSLYFYAYTDDKSCPGDDVPQPERAQWLWSRRYPTMELTHNYGTELDENFRHNNGNEEPLGFGHIGVLVEDVDAAHAALCKDGVKSATEPIDLQNLVRTAVVKDPDGYWVELIQKKIKSGGFTDVGVVGPDPILSQTMLRIKDPAKSLDFYNDLGMKLVTKVDLPERQGSEYVLAYTNDKPPAATASDAEQLNWLFSQRFPTLQLSHKWGTENDPDLVYHNGNAPKELGQGFGHIGIIVSDIYKAVEELEAKGHITKRKPSPFQDVGDIAFTSDPDGYFVELITRNGAPESEPYAKPTRT